MIAQLLFALLQDPSAVVAPPAPPPAAPQAPAASDPAALALLARLATAQHAGGAARVVDGFDVQLVMRERGEQPQEFDFGLNYSRRAGERVAVRIVDRNRGTEVKKGFDGSLFWLEEEKEPGKVVRQDLSGHEYEQDRASIVEALDFASDLLLVLDFHAFARQAESLTLSAGPAQERMLQGRVRRAGGLWDFSILLPPTDPPEGLVPLELRLRQPNEDPLTAAEQPFLVDRRFKLLKFKRFQQRAVPQEIQEFDADAEEPARILEIHDLRWEDLPYAPPPAPAKPAQPK